MASDITHQVCSISELTTAVAVGDLGKLVNFDVEGEVLGSGMTVNPRGSSSPSQHLSNLKSRKGKDLVMLGVRPKDSNTFYKYCV
jgi:hypothetical protein